MSEQAQDPTSSAPSNPYIGPHAFQRGDRLYGRSYEQRYLLDLLIAERIVLLYSPSGAGKTSLIEAGLIPELEAADFFVLPVMRVNPERLLQLTAAVEQADGTQTEPNRYVLSALVSLENGLSDSTPRRTPADLVDLTFNSYLESFPRPSGAPGNTVLIFDQFEEVLTVDPANIEAKRVFFTQLGIALRDHSRWLLCSLREEHVAALEPYVRLVPTHLSTTFRLELLGEEEAFDAAMQPSVDAGTPLDAATVRHLIDDLRRIQVQRLDGTSEEQLGLSVEPLHLQVVFQRLWEQQYGDNQQLEQADVIANNDVDSALAAYYDQEIQRIVRIRQVAERTLREWFDQKLITEQNTRSQVLRRPQQSQGLDNETIQALEDGHLVRSDIRLNATWFELSHDRLIRPIRQSNAAWAEQSLSLFQRQAVLWMQQGRPQGMLLRDEALVKAEQWARSPTNKLTPFEQEFLDQCRQARTLRQQEISNNRRLRLIVVILLILSFLLVGGSWYIIQQQRAARIQQLAAQAREAPERFPEQSLLLALEAADLSQKESIEQTAAQQSLHATLATMGGTPLIGHSDRVRALAFSADGQILATASADATVRLWRVDMPAHATYVLRGHKVGVRTLAFSPSESLLATGGDDGRALLWRIDAPERPPIVLSGHMLSVTALTFSPGGQLLATGDLSGTMRLWRVATPQEPLAVLPNSMAGDLALAFSPDGTLLAVGGPDGKVQLISTAAPLATPRILRKDGARVSRLAFSSDGFTLAVASEQQILLWRLDTALDAPLTLGDTAQQSFFGAITTFAFSPDHTMLAAGSTEGTVLLWRMDALTSPPTVLVGHTQRVEVLAFSQKADYLATGSDDGTALLWTVSALKQVPKVLRGHEGPVRTLAFSPDMRTIATGSDDGSARLWSVNATQSEPTVLGGYGGRVLTVSFNTDNTILVSTSFNGTAQRWKLEGPMPKAEALRAGDNGLYVTAISSNNQWIALAGQSGMGVPIVEMRHITAPMQTTVISGTDRLSGLGFPNILSFSRDGHLLALGSSNGKAFIWQTDALERTPIVADSGAIGNIVLAFTRDGERLATGSSDGTVQIWRTDKIDTPVAVLKGHEQPITAITFSPRESWLATGSDDGTTRLWLLADLRSKPRVLAFQGAKVTQLAFSPAGDWIATAYDDGSVRLWNTNSSQPVATVLPKGHTAAVRSMEFSPDGTLLATGSQDMTTHIWQLNALRRGPVVLRGHTGTINALAFSADARYLATGSDDTTVRLWLLQVNDLSMLACATIGRNLSIPEAQGFEITGVADGHKTCNGLPLHPSVFTAWLIQNKVDQALGAYNVERQRDPTLDLPAAWLVRQAGDLIDQGRIDQALALYTRALKLDDQLNQVDVQALNRICLTGSSERFTEALDACTRAIMLAPENGDYLFNRGLIYRRAGNLEQSIQDFESFLTIVANQPNAGENLPLARRWIDEMQQELRKTPTPTP